jgi:hypothetical protein
MCCDFSVCGKWEFEEAEELLTKKRVILIHCNYLIILT